MNSSPPHPPAPGPRADGEYVAAACESCGLLVQLWEAECELRLNAVLEARGSSRRAAAAGAISVSLGLAGLPCCCAPGRAKQEGQHTAVG